MLPTIERRKIDISQTQLPTPPSSQDEDYSSRAVARLPKRVRATTPTDKTPIPEAFYDLRDIYRCFLKAFSLHLAHNGQASPADIDILLPTITRLYRKRSVGREDLQRMLALFEVPNSPISPDRVLLAQEESPFKLVISGVGSNSRGLIEFVPSQCHVFKPKLFLQDYNALIDNVNSWQRKWKDSFVHAPTEHYPLLAYQTGAQTAIRQAKATAKLNHVLNRTSKPQQQTAQSDKENDEPDFKRLSITDSSVTEEDQPQTTLSTKSRTLSLFDRVKAKQSAAALTSHPTSSEILRRHAIGRIPDVVEILRMKQNQRSQLSGTFNKVSFSMQQTVAMIKSSLSVPMADEEVKLCVDILAREVPGGWLKVTEAGTFQGVVIQGQALRGSEVRDLLRTARQRDGVR